jgi:hypothetical protein
MGYRAFTRLSPLRRLALLTGPGLVLLVLGLVIAGGVLAGIGGMLVVVGVLVFPLAQ